MGVVFFPSLPFMGVMLFPSFMIGNVSGEGGTFLVSPPPFSVILSLPFFSSPSPSFSSFFPEGFFFFFLRELLVLSASKMYSMTPLIVTKCNLIGIKRDFSFYVYEISHSIACNFSEHYMSELLVTSDELKSHLFLVHFSA